MAKDKEKTEKAKGAIISGSDYADYGEYVKALREAEAKEKEGQS